MNHKLIKLLAKKRVERGISQTEVAKRMGTTASSISRFEGNASNHSPALSYIDRYANAINSELNYNLI